MQQDQPSISLLSRVKNSIRLRIATPRYQWVYFWYWKAKLHLWPLGCVFVVIIALGVSIVFRFRLADLLSRVDPAVLPQICIGVGAALIGLIAVVFTLSLFVIQQISDRSVPGILREYAADNATRAIYVSLSLLALVSLSCALLPPPHRVVLFGVPIFCALLSLGLLALLFARVAFLSDPSNIVTHVWGTGMRQIKRLSVVQKEFVQLNPNLRNEVDPFGRTIDNIGANIASLYNQAPYITKKLLKSLDHLHSLLRHFSTEQQYTLLDETARAIVYILTQYIKLRGSGLDMANTTHAMLGLQAGWDRVIAVSLETFAPLMRIGVETGDTQRVQVLVKALGLLSNASVSSVPYNAPPDENPTTAFILGYLAPVAVQSVEKKNEDVVMTLNETILPVVVSLIKGGFDMTAHWQIDEWSKSAKLAVWGMQQTAATETTSTLLKLLSIAVAPEIGDSYLIKKIRDAVLALCQLEATLGTKGIKLGHSLSASPDTPIRLALSGVSSLSIQSIHSKLANLVASNYSDEKHKVWCRSTDLLESLDNELWMRLVAIGEASVSGTESLLFNLNQAAYSVAEQLLWLRKFLMDKQLPPVDLASLTTGEERVAAAQREHQREDFEERLDELLHWHVIAFYSRCRKLQPQAKDETNLRDCFGSAVQIGIQALGVGQTQLAVDVAQTVGNACTALLKDSGVNSIVESCRTVSVLPLLGLVAFHEQSDEVLTAVEAALKKFMDEAQLMNYSPLQNWSAPINLITEQIHQIAIETDRGIYPGARYNVWRPAYSRKEAQEYLAALVTALS